MEDQVGDFLKQLAAKLELVLLNSQIPFTFEKGLRITTFYAVAGALLRMSCIWKLVIDYLEEKTVDLLAWSFLALSRVA